MSHWIEIFYFSIISTALLLSVVGLWFTAVLPGIDRWSKQFFSCYYIVFLLCSFSGFLELTLYYFPVPEEATHLVILLESLLLSLPLPMQTVFLLHCCGESIRSSKLFYSVITLLTVYVVMLISTPFIEGFFYVAPDEHFRRGPLYPLFLLLVIAILLFNLIGTIKRRKQISNKVCFALCIAILPIMVAMIAQLFVDFFPLVDISYVLSSLAMYSFILSDQIEQDRLHQQEIARQQQEIAHEQARVMVLQMRPHFIYNTLMSIYTLCRIDPAKARQITMDFTNYLRKNFNAIASDSAIPFSTELEHTRAYLDVEQVQFDDMLVVEYDTPFTRFRLPPLTLQPIVENAVKHGMDLCSGPLRISVRTRHANNRTEVIVQDNGRGFNPADESKPHTTLSNIRQRLEMMCGGSLVIMAGEGGGTVVTMTIPAP